MSNCDPLRSNINGLSGFPLLRSQWHNDNDDDLGGMMNHLRNFLRVLACSLLVSALPSGQVYADDDGDRHHGDHAFKIDVLSSRPYMVSGGDALVRVTVKKKDVSLGSVRIELNGANITGAFRADAAARTLTGLVTGLRNGENELSVDAKGNGKGDRKSTRLNSSHSQISYAVFCLKKKKN